MEQITDQDLTDMFDDMLNECYPMVTIGYTELYPCDVLKSCDPIAYRIGRDEYADSLVEDGHDVEGY